MTGLEAIALDFDGTVIDTEYTLFASWTRVFEMRGLTPIDPATWGTSVGTSAPAWTPSAVLRDRLEATTSDRELTALLADRLRFHDELLLQQELRPGVLDLLDAAEAAGIPVGIASSSSSAWVSSQLDRLGISHRFAVVACVEAGMPGKPDPAVYRRFCTNVGASPQATVAVDDSPNGVMAAVAAGLDVIAVPNPVTELLRFPVGVRRYGTLAECGEDPALGPLLSARVRAR